MNSSLTSFFAVASVVAVGASMLGCAGDDTNPPLPDAGSGPADATTGAAEAGDASVPVTVAIVRVANWSPDAPAIDFCLAPHGTGTFRGPILAGIAAAENDGGTDGGASLPFPTVSSYFYMAPGAYDARIVAAGVADCSTGIGADATSLPPLARDTFVTIALIGSVEAADAGLGLVGFTDDGTAKSVGLRFINAAPGFAQADLGTGTLTASWKAIFSNVAFGKAGASPASPPDGSTPIDSDGYASEKPLSLATLSAHSPGATDDAVVATDVSAASGSVLTFVLIAADPNAPSDDDASAGPTARLLECVDNAGTIGPFGSCAVLAPPVP
jgi:hypothetical protein